MNHLKDAMLKAGVIDQADVDKAEEKQDVEAVAIILVRGLFVDSTPGRAPHFPRWAERSVNSRRWKAKEANAKVKQHFQKALRHIDRHLMMPSMPLRKLWEKHSALPWADVRKAMSSVRPDQHEEVRKISETLQEQRDQSA